MKQEEGREWLAVSTWLKGFIQSSVGFAFATIVYGSVTLIPRREIMGNQHILQRPLIVYWSWVFLALAIIAGIMGLSGLAGTATALSYVVFLVFFVAYLISFFVGRRPPPIG